MPLMPSSSSTFGATVLPPLKYVAAFLPPEVQKKRISIEEDDADDDDDDDDGDSSMLSD